MYEMPDVIVLLPGITGTQLRKDGNVIWGFSGGSLVKSLLTRGGHLRKALTLKEDPHDVDDLEDGVVADRLMPDLHLLPGLWKIDGYSKVSKVIQEKFEVTKDKNFFHFPYDWRRDNRVAARRLQRQSAEWLRRWRASTGNDNARLILVAHSMGGLISRYFLEVLQGWKDTRALLTFGTPYRGSLNAVDTLANGMKKGPRGLIDLSDMARSFSAIYQLLPIYRCFDPGSGQMIRLTEASAIPNMDLAKVKAARAFHQEIQDAVEANRKEEAYHQAETGYKLFPFVGIAQKTNQAARLEGNGVTMLQEDFEGKNKRGDGTVPRVSAIPPEYGGSGVEKYMATKHGSMQNGADALTNLEGVISTLYFDLGGFLAPTPTTTRIAIETGDLYLMDEPVIVRAQPDVEADVQLRARLVVRGQGTPVTEKEMTRDGDGNYTATFDPLQEGAYAVEINGGKEVQPAAEAFAVAGLSETELDRELNT